MTTHRMTKYLLVCMWFFVLFLSGCANLMKPEIGAMVRPDVRVNLKAGGVQSATLDTKDLVLTYSYSEAGDTFNLSGNLTFDRSLTASFSVVRRFFLKMSFLDNEGRVLETVDITPVMNSFSAVPDNIKIEASMTKPAGSSAIAFNYFGEFRGTGNGEDVGGSQWVIAYFPYD